MHARAWRQLGISYIIDPHGYQVIPFVQRFCNIYGKSVISSPMSAAKHAVYKHFSNLEHAFKLEIEPLVANLFFNDDVFPVPTIS